MSDGRLAGYRRVLANRGVRTALLLGLVLRIPIFAGSVVLTLHVVGHLGRNYAAAGVVAAAGTICVAISGPWRGRLLDRRGLRKVVMPSLIVTAACWSIAPFVSYWPLLVLAALSGLFVVPTFSIVRQSVISAVPEADRRTALSLDSVFVEFSFMIGPLVGVWAATMLPTSWVLFGIEMFGVAGAIVLWLINPPLLPDRATDPEGSAEGAERAGADAIDAVEPDSARPSDSATGPSRREWFTGPFVAMLAAAIAVTVVLSGCDIAIVAALREFGSTDLIGPVLAVWGVGSVIGGLVYGLLHRPIPAFVLLGGLGLITIPIAFAPGTAVLTVLIFVAGLLCAPTITATVDQVSRLVPPTARGEAMGWHGSFMTAGSALGAPLAGVAIDRVGWGGGFLVVAALGVLVALAGLLVTARRRNRVDTAVPVG